MNEYTNVELQLLGFVEKSQWRDGLTYLGENWLEIRGTRDARIAASMGQILIKSGYAREAINWLFERFMYHPRDGELMRWLVEAAAETRDHAIIQKFGEIHEEVKKVKVTPTVHLLNALQGKKLDKRFVEVIRKKGLERMSPRGHRLYMQYLFYHLNDYHQCIEYIQNLPGDLFRWTDFPSHLALSYHLTEQTEKGLESLGPSLQKFDSNAVFTAYEMQRERDPELALEWVNRMLSHRGYAPISDTWKSSGFDLRALSCGPLQPSGDERLVSVIMTVHRMNPMFETAVRSILEQTHRNIELIVVDDASSEEDVEEYTKICDEDPRVRLLHLSKNSGTYVGRNRALQEVNGDFVLFMDSDDWTHPQRIEKSLQRLDASSKGVVSVDSYVRLMQDGSLALIGAYFVRKCMLGLWRTDIVRDELGGFDTVRISADSELLERAQLVYGKESVLHVPVVSYIAYFHNESLTGGERFGFGWRGLVGDRANYAGAFRTWHKRMRLSLSDVNMAALLAREEPFVLPRGFLRDENRKLPLSRDRDDLALLQHDCQNSICSTFFDVPLPVPPSDDEHVSVCMATYPGRFKTVARTVETLLDQSRMPDAIHLWVNESSVAPPLPDDPRIVVHLAPDNNLTDIGKFAAAAMAPEGIIICADDDLNYPTDYVERMVNEVNRFDGRACVGLHGVVFPLDTTINSIEQYFTQRRVHLFSRGLSVHLPCHVLGTGTMAYDSRQIQFDFEEWHHHRMVDLHVGAECQRKQIPMVILPRDGEWLRPFDAEEDDVSIWQSIKGDIELQTNMVSVLESVNDWSFHLQDGQIIRSHNLLQSYHREPPTVVPLDVPITPASPQTYDVSLRWSQEGRTLLFDAKKRTIKFEMPVGWRLEHTHPDLFRLTHYLLMSPWENHILDDWTPTRKQGWRPAISYSGGIDSHACLSLMPKNTLVMYHERYGFNSKLDHSNAFKMLDALRADGYAVVVNRSNHELIRMDYGKGPGFSTDFAVGAMSILLADFFGLSGIAFGMPLENSYLFHGHEGRDFSKSWYWNHFKSLFKKAGLDLILPTAGVSELTNLKIVDASPHGHLAQSCLRSSTAGEVCGVCWKCFRKNSLRGEPVQFSDEVLTFLNKQPLKQAASTIFALKHMSSKEQERLRQIPALHQVLDLDVDWLNRYHPDAERYVPQPYRNQFSQKLQSFADVMSEEERTLVQSLVLYDQNDE